MHIALQLHFLKHSHETCLWLSARLVEEHGGVGDGGGVVHRGLHALLDLVVIVVVVVVVVEAEVPVGALLELIYFRYPTLC